MDKMGKLFESIKKKNKDDYLDDEDFDKGFNKESTYNGRDEGFEKESPYAGRDEGFENKKDAKQRIEDQLYGVSKKDAKKEVLKKLRGF